MSEATAKICCKSWLCDREEQCGIASSLNLAVWQHWSRGVTVSTQDSESCDPSSNLGGTWLHFSWIFTVFI